MMAQQVPKAQHLLFFSWKLYPSGHSAMHSSTPSSFWLHASSAIGDVAVSSHPTNSIIVNNSNGIICKSVSDLSIAVLGNKLDLAINACNDLKKLKIQRFSFVKIQNPVIGFSIQIQG